MQKLLIAAVADADVTVRHSIFSSLYADGGFDEFLAQADSLTAIFATLNDEVFNSCGPSFNSQNGKKIKNAKMEGKMYCLMVIYMYLFRKGKGVTSVLLKTYG